MNMNLSIIILAAGQGTRMKSEIPKVLHNLAGKPLLEHVYNAASQLKHSDIHVVYGYGGDQVKTKMSHLEVNWVEQAEQLGTGHAVKLVMPDVAEDNLVLILYGDIPLITTDTLNQLVDAAKDTGFSLLTSFPLSLTCSSFRCTSILTCLLCPEVVKRDLSENSDFSKPLPEQTVCTAQ